MLIKNPHRAHLSARDQRGFTLIETLVAILTGVVVTGALFAILEVSLHQTSRLTDYVQANQLGRTAMNKVVGELHSACLSPEFTPVQEKSTESTLWFVNANSEKSVIEKTEAHEHKLVWNESSKTLTDYTYLASSGEWPKFTFSSSPTPASGKLLAENIYQAEVEKGGKKVKLPIFRYYKYAASSSSSSETGQSTLEEVKSPETATEAKEISSVNVTFRAAAADNNIALGRPAELNSQVTFAFTAPYAETPIVDAPCQ